MCRCKKCLKCEIIYSTKTHHNCCNEKLISQKCHVKFILLTNDKRSLLYVCGEHTHSNPPPDIVPKTIKKSIEDAINSNSNLKTQEVSRGIGVGMIPSQLCPALSLRKRLASLISRARKKILPPVVNISELKSIENNLKEKEEKINDKGISLLISNF